MISVSENEVRIEGTKLDILACVSQLFSSLNSMEGFTEEELRHAVDVGFWSDEQLEEETTKVAHEAAELCGLRKLSDLLSALLDDMK